MIGENLQYLRKMKNLTQEALAERIGVSRQTIVKWENGESTPDLAMAGCLSAELEVPLDELVNTPMAGVQGDLRGKHVFGLVTVGDKGQIVIPAKARKMFDISSGDQLVVLGDEGQGIAIVKAEDFLSLANMINKLKR